MLCTQLYQKQELRQVLYVIEELMKCSFQINIFFLFFNTRNQLFFAGLEIEDHNRSERTPSNTTECFFNFLIYIFLFYFLKFEELQ